MSKATISRTNATEEPHGYHSAVEVDEEVGSWKDWVGPGLAILALLVALVVVVLMLSGVPI